MAKKKKKMTNKKKNKKKKGLLRGALLRVQGLQGPGD